MPDVICDTSPLQYLHQLGVLESMRSLLGRIVVPPAVVAELNEGRSLGVDLPDLQAMDWVTIRVPQHAAAAQLLTDLGPGETQVLMPALEVLTQSLCSMMVWRGNWLRLSISA